MGNLRDLIDEPVAPRTAFADELRSRLMRELSANDYSREEQAATMDATIAPRPPLALPVETPRRNRPMVILEVAAAAIIILGLAATLGRGWFGNDPGTPTSVPAAALQDSGTPTPEAPVDPTVQPTLVPPGNMAGTLWTLPDDSDIVDFGGLLVEDDMVYRLIATTNFVGLQAIDGKTGTVKWQQAHQWSGDLFALEDDTLFFDGGDNTLVAVDAETGAETWRAQVDGNPIAIAEDNDRIYVLLDTDFVAALDAKTGERRWSVQGTPPQNLTGGSASIPAIGKIAVDNGVVAAVSTYGVLSGFDAQTGTELWSHEGFDAATVSIATENDRFIVIDGAGPAGTTGFGIGVDGPVIAAVAGTPGAALADAPATTHAEGATPGTGCGVVFGTASGSVEAGAASVAGTVQGSAPSGTPVAGVTTSEMTGTTFRVQGIDPTTGEIIWAQQTAPGMAGGMIQGGGPSSLPAKICTIDVENGSVTSVSVAGSPGAGGVEEGHVAVGSVSSGVFVPAQAADGDMPVSVSAEAGAIAGLDQPAIAVATDDDGIYLQLQDGTLMKIDGGQSHGEAGQRDDFDDDHTEGTTESDDD
jgi:outer membrane protein assembly factor BamB